MLNLLDPATQFLSFALLTMYADLIFAKWLKFRWYVAAAKRRPRKLIMGLKAARRLHIHHFNFGLALLPPTLLALYYDQGFAYALAGIMSSLVGSEAYELVTMRWGK